VPLLNHVNQLKTPSPLLFLILLGGWGIGSLVLLNLASGSAFGFHPFKGSLSLAGPPLSVHTATTLGSDAAPSTPSIPESQPMSIPNAGVAAPASSSAVEPFDLVRGDLKNLKMHIKELMERHVGSRDATLEGGTNPLLQEAAREFFERKERAWRPGTVLLMARALAVEADNESNAAAAAAAAAASASSKMYDPSPKQLQLAEIVEMMVTAQVIHDDVLEDLEMDQEGKDGASGEGETAAGVAADSSSSSSSSSSSTSSQQGNIAHRMYSSALGNKVVD
jgi:hypothetical protein